MWAAIGSLSEDRVLLNEMKTRAAILFSAKDDDLRLPEGFEDFSAGLSVFAVGETPTDPGDLWAFIDLGTAGQGTSGMKIALGRVRESEQVVYSVEDLQFQMRPFVEAMPPGKGFEGISAIQDASKMVRLYKRGQPLANGTLLVPRKVNRKINRVGANFKGQLAEILLYKRSLSELERIGVEAYLKDRYFPGGAAAAPPAEKR